MTEDAGDSDRESDDLPEDGYRIRFHWPDVGEEDEDEAEVSSLLEVSSPVEATNMS